MMVSSALLSNSIATPCEVSDNRPSAAALFACLTFSVVYYNAP